jgi:hypothetical protein
MNRILARVQSAPILAVFAAVLVWSFGPIITLSIGVSINTTIFYRVIFGHLYCLQLQNCAECRLLNT